MIVRFINNRVPNSREEATMERKTSDRMSDESGDQDSGISNLRRAMAPFGIKVKKYIDEYGIDPSRIIEYRKDDDGNCTFLCRDYCQDMFYILRATKKTADWKKINAEFEKD